jgi:hypothetical protein
VTLPNQLSDSHIDKAEDPTLKISNIHCEHLLPDVRLDGDAFL